MVFRNDPCPCGSGKRYKKCCLKKAKKAEQDREKLAETRQELEVLAKKLAAEGYFLEDDNLDELDDLSNSVPDLINEKKFDEALGVCARLLEEWPEVPDGFERSGMVYEAMGELDKAKDFYARALAFTQRPDQRDGFDDDGLPAFCRERIAAIEARSSGAS